MSSEIRSEIGEQAKELLLPALHAVVDARTAEGVRKYGQTLDQNIKPQRAKVVHLLQEILDALQYVLWGAAEDRQADVMCMQLAGMANDLIRLHRDLDLGELLFKEGHSAQQPAPVVSEWANIPLDLARVVVAVGDAGAAVTEIQDAEEHGRMMAESVRLTAEHFNQPDGPRAMYWVNVEGTDRVIAYTGTSPNSQEVSRALAGAWNLLRQHCQAALAAAEAGDQA